VQKIHPFLWFSDQAEQAMEFYLSVFKNSKRGQLVRYGEGGPGPKDSVMVANFEIEGMEVTALNGGPLFKFNESVSLVVRCDSQAEIDYYWEKLTADGGAPGNCGWLKDKFGLSWQVVSPQIIEMITASADPARSQRGMAAMMKMHKLDIAAIKAACDG
jgi:predicted 3-demethylubiquinone-9 3-methyltransferase (glyoxalase superfamily)